MRLAPLIGRSLFVVGVLAVGSALAWVQSDWIRTSTAVEEDGLRASMSARVERALSESFRELGGALAALSAQGEAYADWLATAPRPELLGPLYLIAVDASQPVLRYDPQARRFVAQTDGSAGLAAVRSAFSAGRLERSAQESLVRKTGFYAVAAEGRPRASAVVAAEVRFDVLYGGVLAEALERHAPGYVVEVRRRGGPATHRSWQPDLAMDLPRSLAEPRPGVPPLGPIWGALEVASPGGPIADVVRRHRVRNMAIGYGGIGLVVSAALAGLSLYGRASALRRRERELVASVSHELRTPIAVIASLSDNLRSGVVRDVRKLSEYGDMLREEARRLSSMVEGILAYSRIESGRASRGLVEDFPLRAALVELARSLEAMCREAGARCKIDVTGAPESARCDAEAIRLVLTNLVANALRHGFAEGDGAVVRAAVCTEGDGVVVIRVEDEGPGIPRREQRRVFDPFTRGRRSVAEGRPGSGLGLFIVKRTADLGGGSVALESPYLDSARGEHGGCRFTVRLRVG